MLISKEKLNKILKNSKHSIKLKDKFKIVIKGIFHRKEKIIKPTPKWFKDWNKDFENKITKLLTKSNENVETQITKLKEDFDTKITNSNENVETQITKLKEDLETQITKSNENVETKITKLKEDLETKITKLKEDLETKITKSNENVETKITKLKEYFDTKIPKWFKDWNEKTFIPFKEKVEKDIAAMKNTPTMKKELGLS